MKVSITIFVSIGLLLLSQLSAKTWVRGAWLLHEVSGGVELKELGGRRIAVVEGQQLPWAISGLINCEADSGSAAFFSASNRSHLYFEGPGEFAIERFEQIAPDPAAWQSSERETAQSRMILNFRSGGILMDSRESLESSLCFVETPLGRLTVKRALWQMQITFDPSQQAFDFTITCSEGQVRFTDLQDQRYTLHGGQRLSGAGVRTSPSIAVGEKTEQSQKLIQRYRKLENAHQEAAQELTRYLDHLQKNRQETQLPRPQKVRHAGEKSRRPIVIEYAKDPEAVTPFRGEVKPPERPREVDTF